MNRTDGSEHDSTARIGVNGVSGQMGQTLLATAAERPGTTVVCGIAPGGDSAVASDGLPVYDPADRAVALADHEPDAVVDFSTPQATTALAETAADAGVGLVVGTTGFDEPTLATLRTASERIPIVRASNFSRGLQALLAGLESLLGALPAYDIEVLETHHSNKQDAPSGTTSTILETVADYRDVQPVAGRAGEHARRDDEVGVLVRRAGDVRGEHELLLAGNDEVVTLRHRVEDRSVFAAGALDAAEWLVDRSAGWYTVEDVIQPGDQPQRG